MGLAFLVPLWFPLLVIVACVLACACCFAYGLIRLGDLFFARQRRRSARA